MGGLLTRDGVGEGGEGVFGYFDGLVFGKG